jgi:Type I restriction enzyme R protein N terminus (HSDR_N)
MQTGTRPDVDILVTANGGQPLVAVEVKRHGFDQYAREQILHYSQAVGADFLMMIDPMQIIVTPVQGGEPQWERSITLPTPTILSHYTHAPDLRKIEGFYLESLTEAWLRDFSFSWKFKHPPGYEELDQIGLASRLQNSETHSDGSI